MGKVENATIGKMKVEEQEPVDSLLEKVKLPDAEDYRIMDMRLSAEIVEGIRGHYTEELIYNFPRAGGSKNKWPECKLMKGGCTYEGKTNHIHILGVGYQGALTAMRAYGQMDALVDERPEVVEEAGILYWAACAEVTDKHNGNTIRRWYLEPVFLSTRKGVIEKEFASSVAQSKALRNCVLALIPHDLLKQWIEDYRSGKKPFDPERAKEMGYSSAEPKPKQPSKRQPRKSKKQGNDKPKQLQELAGELASKRDLNLQIVNAWIEMRDATPGQNTLFLHRVNSDDNTWAEAEKDYRDFEEKWLQAEEDKKATEDFFENGERKHNPPA